jgi:primosomal protein N' (replication factor Y)
MFGSLDNSTEKGPAPGAATSAETVADVAVLAPVPGPYTYAVPAALLQRLVVGSRVLVPLGGQKGIEGVVLRIGPPTPKMNRAGEPRKLRPITQRIEGKAVPAELIGLVSFIAEYYLSPLGEALRLVLPPHEQAQREIRVALSPSGTALCEQTAQALLSPAVAELLRPQQELLTALRELLLGPSRRRKEVELPLLLRALPGRTQPELEATLESLRATGHLVVTERVTAGVPDKKEAWVKVKADSTEPSIKTERFLERSPARDALYRQILRFGPLPVAELRVLSPRASELCKQLQSAGLVEVEERVAIRDALAELDADDPSSLNQLAGRREPPVLTDEQEQALTPMLAALSQGYRGFLLHGVTGSGKTELYLRLIATALAQKKSALVLVPEIALTPQLAARFVARFGPKVAVLHSGLSPGQRADAWRRILQEDGEVRIALGPRSALFAPLSNLGVVIVDEEHDASFKQQEGVRYHGRDVALVRAQRAGAVAVLGSATPSLESLALSRRGKLTLLSLHKRATGVPMPSVEIIDLKKHILSPEQGLLSTPLERALAETLGAGEQALLFLNRRGYATFLLCKACGNPLQCRHCAVTLTWHKARERLLCHYCGYNEAPTEICPSCQTPTVIRLGLGTEKLAEQIAARFPAARIARLDRDTSSGPSGLTPLLSAMHRREIDILIGTQMLAKGHDFPGVTLVGVVLADTGMGLPDFRASERTFQLLAQVAGRAGRQGRAGRVLIQTYNPEHPAVTSAVEHDFNGFAEMELAAREALGYAPSMRIGLLRLDGKDPLEVRRGAEAVARRTSEEITRTGAPVSVQGPVEAPLSRLKDRTRWQLLLRGKTPQALRAVLWAALRVPKSELGRGVRIHADVDPASTL